MQSLRVVSRSERSGRGHGRPGWAPVILGRIWTEHSEAGGVENWTTWSRCRGKVGVAAFIRGRRRTPWSGRHQPRGGRPPRVSGRQRALFRPLVSPSRPSTVLISVPLVGLLHCRARSGRLAPGSVPVLGVDLSPQPASFEEQCTGPWLAFLLSSRTMRDSTTSDWMKKGIHPLLVVSVRCRCSSLRRSERLQRARRGIYRRSPSPMPPSNPGRPGRVGADLLKSAAELRGVRHRWAPQYQQPL